MAYKTIPFDMVDSKTMERVGSKQQGILQPHTLLSMPLRVCHSREVIEARISTYPVGAVRIDETAAYFHSCSDK
jgi:hypothetical protein